ncbi:MAG TPA: tetratricopeptide repeat protein [Afifellaceae bacterium]|nr:tetratricopeptide repeat protein [Afifellaceae bacterium]
MDQVTHRRLRFAGHTLDLARFSLSRGDQEIMLRPKSFDVLRHLAENPGRLITKNELIEKVWLGIAVTDDSLVQCVKDIRDALDDDDHRIIQTLPRRGYLFAAEISDSAAPDSQERVPASTEQSLAQSVPPARHAGISRTARSKWVLAAAATALLLVGILSLTLRPLTGAPGAVSASGPEAAGQADMVPAQSMPSIAVLPFVSLSEARNDYVADGLTDDIISALGRFTDLSVRSRAAVFSFKGKTPRPEQIGRDLDVRYVVEGSVRRSPERVRITVRLTETSHGTVLWARQYDADPSSLYGVEEDIVRRIAGTLAIRVSRLELARAAAKPPASVEAYDLVLQGRSFYWRETRTSIFQARTLFETAVLLDPNYVPALIGLGHVESKVIAQGWTADPAEALRRAERLAQRVLQIDESHPGGHQLLAHVHVWRGEFERALEAARRAIELNPSDVENYLALAEPLLWSGDLGGAIAALETATRFEPQTTAYIGIHLGMAYLISGRDEDAIRILERAIDREGSNVFINAILAGAYAETGRAEEASRHSEIVRRLSPFLPTTALGSQLRNLEHRQKFLAALQKAGL